MPLRRLLTRRRGFQNDRTVTANVEKTLLWSGEQKYEASQRIANTLQSRQRDRLRQRVPFAFATTREADLRSASLPYVREVQRSARQVLQPILSRM